MLRLCAGIKVGGVGQISVRTQNALGQHGDALIDLVGNLPVVRGRHVGIRAVDVHIGDDPSAGFQGNLVGSVVIGNHGIDDLARARLVENGAAQNARAVHPGGTGIVGEQNQRVKLVLVQGDASAGYKAVDGGIQLLQLGTQSLVGIRLLNAVGVMVTGLGADGAITAAPLGANLRAGGAIFLKLL